MNERLVELYRSCKTKEALASQDQYKSADVLIGTELAKFAELIIKECASLNLEPMQVDDAQYYHGWLDYRDEIRKHFGVK